jgi:NAD(P)-dependent dehydrogenase (short-subunit alcohol dehydrogenase family)
MKKNFHGKVALVTGAASGIGKVAAQLLAREGASVVVTTDSNIKGGEDTVNSIKSAGGEAAFVKCDVSKAADVEATVNKCVELYGRLDFAFNNAGIGPDGVRVPMFSIADCPEEIWDRTIAINLTGAFLCMKYEIRQMMKQNFGVIVNTSSVGGSKAVPGFCAYGSSKAGLIHLTKIAALEYASSGIRVNAILPGNIDRTQLVKNITASHPEEWAKIVETAPMRRLGEPEDIAEAVIYLCSDKGNFITGIAMNIDGGLLIG